MGLLENKVSVGSFRVVLVDFSWLLRKSYHFYKAMEFRGRPIGHVYGVLNSVGRLLKWAKDSRVRFIFAVDTPTVRDMFVPHYKGGREKGTNLSLLSVDFPIIRDVILSSGLAEFVGYKGFEADDVIYSLSFQEESPLLWGEDMDLFQSPVLTKYFTNVEKGGPIIKDIMGEVKGKVKNYHYHNNQVNIPFTLLAALGKPSNNLPVAVRRSDKHTLSYLADKDCPLRQDVLDRFYGCWAGGRFNEPEFFRSIMGISFLPGNNKYKENLYCSFPRYVPKELLRVVSVPENKARALQFLMTNQMHTVLETWGGFLR